MVLLLVVQTVVSKVREGRKEGATVLYCTVLYALTCQELKDAANSLVKL
jgi:hypothetical protein